MTEETPKTYVIIGGVAGGMSSATRLRRLDAQAHIIVLERSNYVSYANCGLPYHLGGIINDRESLLLQTPDSLKARFDLDVRVGVEAVKIDADNRVVDVRVVGTDRVEAIHYDALVLSPGAKPIIPDIPGVELAMPLRTVEDMDALVARIAARPQHVTVIGGGFIGLEVAENLRHQNIDVTLLEAAPQVLAPLDPEMVGAVQDSLREHGVDVRLQSVAAEIETNAVVLADGTRIETELVVLAIGVRPDTALAAAAGLDVGPRGGILVDEHQLTSNKHIYAIGDAAEKKDALDGSASLVPLANIANRQGRLVADHICGLEPKLVDAQVTAIVKVFDLTIATTGWNEKRLRATGREFVAIHTHPASHAGYCPGQEPMSIKLLFDPNTHQILGAQAVGREGVDKRIDVIATAMRGGITAPELLDLELAYAPPFSSAKDPVNMLGYIADNLATGQSQTVQWSELGDALADGAVLVDVRSAAEHAQISIPGAINIPIDELRDRLSEIPGRRVIVHCAVGQRGHTAEAFLRQAGYDVRNLDGGIKTWSSSPAAQM